MPDLTRPNHARKPFPAVCLQDLVQMLTHLHQHLKAWH